MLGTVGEALGNPLGLGPRMQLQRQTGYGVSGRSGAQWPGEETRPDPFMDVEPVWGLFQHSFQKNKGNRSEQLMFCTMWVSGEAAGELGGPNPQTEARFGEATPPWGREGELLVGAAAWPPGTQGVV